MHIHAKLNYPYAFAYIPIPAFENSRFRLLSHPDDYF